MTADELRDRIAVAIAASDSDYWTLTNDYEGDPPVGQYAFAADAVLALPEVARALATRNYVLAEQEWPDSGDDNCADCSGSGHNDLLRRLRAVADGGDT